MTTQTEMFTATEARDAALEQVAENAGTFVERGIEAIAKLPAGEYTGEDVRVHLQAQGIRPHHHNAWGALIRTAVKRGFLVYDGRHRQMETTKSHARMTPVYRAE